MKQIFTTGQVAQICKVAPRVVARWFDSGRLLGYRIPGSQDRRIHREHLIRFLKEHGMPLGDLEDEAMVNVLLVGVDIAIKDLLQDQCGRDIKVHTAASRFEAGIQIESVFPECVVIDFSIGDSEAVQLADNMSRNQSLRKIVVFGLFDKRPDERIYDLKNFNQAMQKAHDAQTIIWHIKSLLRAYCNR